MSAPETTTPASGAGSVLVDAFRDQCVLVRLRVRAPSRTRGSARATDAAREATGATSGTYRSDIMLKSLSLAMGACARKAIRHLERATCPFGDARLALLDDYIALRADLARFADQYVALAREATADWDHYAAEVERQCEGLWDERFLPDERSAYLEQCALDVEVLPTPDTPPQIALPAAFAAAIQEEIEEGVHERYRQALNAQRAEFVDVLGEVLDRLGSRRRTTKGTLRPLGEIALRVERFNLTGDRSLGTVCRRAVEIARNVDPKLCNLSPDYRVTIIQQMHAVRQQLLALE